MDNTEYDVGIGDVLLALVLLGVASGLRVLSVATVEGLLSSSLTWGSWAWSPTADATDTGQRIERIGARLPVVACFEEALV